MSVAHRLLTIVGIALAAAATATAATLATNVGSIGDFPGSPLGGHFDPVDGVAHSLIVYDADQGGWTILSEAGTEMGLTDGYCGSSLFRPSMQQFRCSGALRVDLGDFSDSFLSSSTRTKATGVPGLVVNGESGRDSIKGGPLPDTIRGGTGNDTLDGGNGDDKVVGESGDDALFGGVGADELEGGDGSDTVNYPGTTGIVVTLADELANDGQPGEGDRLRGIEHVGGSQAGDRLSGDGVDNRLDGGKGDDRLYGGGGSDILIGGAGSDSLVGGSGVDRLEGGDGADRLVSRDAAYDYVTCGSGVDVVEADGGDGVDETTCETVMRR